MEGATVTLNVPSASTAKPQIFIRLKPKGTGASDQISTYQEWKKIGAVDFVNNSLTIEDTRSSAGKTLKQAKDIKYTYPAAIVPGEMTNAQIFKPLIGDYIDKFIEGYNVNYMAFGQTGSGKTYTLIGERGSFKSAAQTVDDCPPGWGLFPRTVLEILNRIGNDKNKKLAACIAEANYRDPIDLVTKNVVFLDPRNDELMGMTYNSIESPEDLLNLCKVVEKERTCAPTVMNHSSSRTHCFIIIKLYQVTGG